MNRETILRQRLRRLTVFFIIGLALSGATAIPLNSELAWLAKICGVNASTWIPRDNGLRGIPIWWRLIDCSFGVVGFIPLWFCRQWAIELEQFKQT